MYIVNITQDDLYIRIYGSQLSYNFEWTASYSDSSTVEVDVTISSAILGDKNEVIVVEFPYPNTFKSIYSERGVNPETQLTGYLVKSGSVATSKSVGQTTIYIFAVSIFLALLSSFGGNSMEMMWWLTNTLQLAYFLSKVNVNFPDQVVSFFDYLKFTNANNNYMSDFAFLMISEDKFKRGDVNERMGSKVFYISWSDKIPWTIGVIIFFVIIKIVDHLKYKPERKCLNFLAKLFDYFKYDFFIRMSMEVFLEINFNAILNMYFIDFSTIYEIISASLAIFYLIILSLVTIFWTFYLLKNHQGIIDKPANYESCSCLYIEIDRNKPSAVYFFIFFFMRRLIFWIGIVWFYNTAAAQIPIWIATSAGFMLYSIVVRPYKYKTLNFFSLVNEIWIFFASFTLLFFEFHQKDQDPTSSSQFQIVMGWALISLIGVWAWINFLYLVPIKAYESAILLTRVSKYVFYVLYKCKFSDVDAHKGINHTLRIPRRRASSIAKEEIQNKSSKSTTPSEQLFSAKNLVKTSKVSFW